MKTMHETALEAIGLIPAERRFRPQDAAAITEHRDLLLSIEPDLIKGFYDTLYAHPPTAQVLGIDERPSREETLSGWWRRTVNGPLDEDYFAWMAMVGLVHVVRNVTNPMMLPMVEFVSSTATAKIHASAMPPDAAADLVDAVRRLCATVASIITYGYDQAVVSALYSVAGMPEGLLRRLRDQEVESELAKSRTELGLAAR
ncbi:protoglobin domain-containing protein [Kineosporia sp. R_H_3]|uniref:protoglobin domain-containing protein n=1 Tax=Kineosporia sp. R_H_3 TaxID=1961848 RepID=UPI000B4BD3E1|nr:protoglobin domain-containing protein [Kineosporia sp. R_H_3]